MKLTFTPKTKLRELKKQFSRAFPFLKLEFFAEEHRVGAGSVVAERITDHTPVSAMAPLLSETVLSFTPGTTVAELEQTLQNKYGLPVQVFRKTGNLWLETAQTDNLSLEKQNALGRESCLPLRFNMHTLFL